MHERSLILLRNFINYKYPQEYLLDTSNLTIEKTVENILDI